MVSRFSWGAEVHRAPPRLQLLRQGPQGALGQAAGQVEGGLGPQGPRHRQEEAEGGAALPAV